MSRARRMLALALVWGSVALPALGAGFTDLDAEDSRTPLASLLAQKGILVGTSDAEFAGSSPLSRYELASSLNAMLDPHDVPFNVVAWSDVPPGHPLMPAVSRVTSLNLLGGEGGRFYGLRHVKRSEYVEALVKLLTYRAVAAPPHRRNLVLSFSDIPADTATGRMLDRAANYWLILDAPGRIRFRPHDLVTRFEALDMLARTILLLDDPTLKEAVKAAMVQPPSPAPTPSPEPSPTPLPTPRPLPMPGATPFVAPTMRPSAQPTPVPNVMPALLPKASPSPTPTALPTPGPLVRPMPSPSLEPTPHRPFWDNKKPESPSPAPSAASSPAANVAPEPPPKPSPVERRSPATRTQTSSELFKNGGRLGFDLVLYYRDGVPGDSTLAGATDKSDLQAMAPGFLNFDLSGQAWMGEFGGSGGISTIYPVTVALSGGSRDLAFISTHGEGLYRLPWKGPDWESAAGLGLMLGLINGSGTDYLTTTKTTFGVGPAGLYALRLMPGMVMTTALQLYPLDFQSHSIAGTSKSANRLGGAWQLGTDYEFMRTATLALSASVNYHGSCGLMLDGTAIQTIHLVSLGVGGRL